MRGCSSCHCRNSNGHLCAWCRLIGRSIDSKHVYVNNWTHSYLGSVYWQQNRARCHFQELKHGRGVRNLHLLDKFVLYVHILYVNILPWIQVNDSPVDGLNKEIKKSISTLVFIKKIDSIGNRLDGPQSRVSRSPKSVDYSAIIHTRPSMYDKISYFMESDQVPKTRGTRDRHWGTGLTLRRWL